MLWSKVWKGGCSIITCPVAPPSGQSLHLFILHVFTFYFIFWLKKPSVSHSTVAECGLWSACWDKAIRNQERFYFQNYETLTFSLPVLSNRQPNCCTKLETSEDQKRSSRQHTPKCFVPISVGFGTLWILLTPLPLLLICPIPHWFLIPVPFMVIFANVCMKNDFYYLYNQYFVHNVYHKYAAWTYF